MNFIDSELNKSGKFTKLSLRLGFVQEFTSNWISQLLAKQFYTFKNYLLFIWFIC